MATPSIQAIDALRNTANRLENGAEYKWTHMSGSFANRGRMLINTNNRRVALSIMPPFKVE